MSADALALAAALCYCWRWPCCASGSRGPQVAGLVCAGGSIALISLR
ncbi:hypothetical protein OIE63_33085 [Streptomyces sp. NBC_01795]|nr:hypothetical protein [Streptomyces sp. NBC_01795]WSA95852.1 hypothetical protein OIE63_33085 [Streptomyces sp. NBC_01795]